jgi:hypothetical protein
MSKQLTLKHRQIITDQFTSASVSVNQSGDKYSFNIRYSIIEDITKFIQRRFSDVIINNQTTTTIEGYFSGVK